MKETVTKSILFKLLSLPLLVPLTAGGLSLQTAGCTTAPREHRRMPAKAYTPYSTDHVKAIVKLHNAAGGVTFNPHRGGNQLGQEGLAVGVFKSREQIVKGKHLNEETVRDYIQKNEDLLMPARYSLGSWYDADSDQTFLDIVLVLPHHSQRDQDLAVACGRSADQQAIFDLESKTVIDLSDDDEEAASSYRSLWADDMRAVGCLP